MSNWTPLMIAASAGWLQIVKTLIGQGAQIAEVILENGGDPHTSDNLGHTPMHRAACKGHLKMVKLLLQYNVDLNHRDATGSTPL
nr:hypothetical protein BaRGS_014011 [Batillaria attramentaria]